MKYPIYNTDGSCPKCGFPFIQMFKQIFNGEHDIVINKDVKECKVKGEHLHLECCCGHELILRPLDYKVKK